MFLRWDSGILEFAIARSHFVTEFLTLFKSGEQSFWCGILVVSSVRSYPCCFQISCWITEGPQGTSNRQFLVVSRVYRAYERTKSFWNQVSISWGSWPYHSRVFFSYHSAVMCFSICISARIPKTGAKWGINGEQSQTIIVAPKKLPNTETQATEGNTVQNVVTSWMVESPRQTLLTPWYYG